MSYRCKSPRFGGQYKWWWLTLNNPEKLSDARQQKIAKWVTTCPALKNHKTPFRSRQVLPWHVVAATWEQFNPPSIQRYLVMLLVEHQNWVFIREHEEAHGMWLAKIRACLAARRRFTVWHKQPNKDHTPLSKSQLQRRACSKPGFWRRELLSLAQILPT